MKRPRLSVFVVGFLAGSVGWAAESRPSADTATSSPELTFDYFVNNWNVVGLKDYQRGARVMPDNRIQLAGKNAAVQVRFGRTLQPLRRQHGKLAQTAGCRSC